MTRSKLDVGLLFGTRIARLFGYGFVSVVLALYLTTVGLGTGQIGILLTLTLAGDAAISLWLTTTADRMGRKRTLVMGAAHCPLVGRSRRAGNQWRAASRSHDL